MSNHNNAHKAIAEKHFTEVGTRMIDTPIRTMIGLIFGSIVPIIAGAIIPFIDNDEEFLIAGLIIIGIGCILLSIGIWGVCRYHKGWDYLAMGELLYNTRVAVDEEPTTLQKESPIVNSVPCNKPVSTSNNAASAQIFPSGEWICACGRKHPAYVSTCYCGISKRDAKQSKSK